MRVTYCSTCSLISIEVDPRMRGKPKAAVVNVWNTRSIPHAGKLPIGNPLGFEPRSIRACG